MSNQHLKLRRSSVPGKIPTTGSIDFGEIALNTYDGLAFLKKSGSMGEEIVTIGASNTTTASVAQINSPDGSNVFIRPDELEQSKHTTINIYNFKNFS